MENDIILNEKTKHIYKQKLLEFYKSNKTKILSCDKIISISSSLYSLYPYGTFNKNRVVEISEKKIFYLDLKVDYFLLI